MAKSVTKLTPDITSDGWVTSDVHKRIELVSSIMGELDAIWKQSIESHYETPSLYLPRAFRSVVWVGNINTEAR